MLRRTVTNKVDRVDAIITADWHLRDTAPICRVDNFWETQWGKVAHIRVLQKKYDCPVLHAGDLFDSWKASPYLLRETLRSLPDQFYTIYGNHDLPQHNLELHEKSAVDVLDEAERIHLMSGVHWGQKLASGEYYHLEIRCRKILMMHTMTWKTAPAWPGDTSPSASALLRRYPKFDLIVVGHNHKSFVVSNGGRLLISPGSITRQAANKDEDKPRVYLWNAAKNKVQVEYLPYDPNAVTREHIEETRRRDSRIMAFVERLQGEWEIGNSFEENLRKFLAKNRVRQSVKDIIRKALEEEA